MRYMGSKRRIADEILPIILKDRKPNQWFVEPFCGGCNITKLVDGKVLASDINSDIIAFYIALQKGWLPPKTINEDDYKRIVANGSPELRGYAGITHSFGGKFLSTYRRQTDNRISKKLSTGNTYSGRDLKGNYLNIEYNGEISYRTTLEFLECIRHVKFKCCNYYDLDIPDNSIIYCDPPYQNTSDYTTGVFPHRNFWRWCERMAGDGHKVFISEYNAPKPFKSVWEKQITTHLNAKRANAIKEATEKLFTI